MTIRKIMAVAALGVTFAAPTLAQLTPIPVMKTSGCGCCLAWMEHLEENGFAPEGENMFAGLLVRYKLDNGVPPRMISCHTAKVGGYVIEGHVPADDIRRLLEQRPDVVGLAVPGMPVGSPGMDFGSSGEAYDVFVINRDGSTEVFSSYAAK